MNRRRSFASLAIVALGLIFVGLGARRGDAVDDDGDLCEPDLRDAFEFCAPGQKMGDCEYVSEEFEDACQAGCVLEYCRQKITCTEMAPIWCAPCSDPHGAPFYRNLSAAKSRCMFFRPAGEWTPNDSEKLTTCFNAEVERRCPALIGTDWDSQMRAAFPTEENKNVLREQKLHPRTNASP